MTQQRRGEAIANLAPALPKEPRPQPDREEIALPRIPADSAWTPFERDALLRLEFSLRHMDPEVCVLLIGAAILKYGESAARGATLVLPRWAVEAWIRGQTGIGPKLARQVVLVALDRRYGGRPDLLRLRAGRVELRITDPSWPRAVR